MLKLSVSSLRSPEMALVKEELTQDADSKKIEQEFEEYQAKLKQQKEDWAREHPDQVCSCLLEVILQKCSRHIANRFIVLNKISIHYFLFPDQT